MTFREARALAPHRLPVGVGFRGRAASKTYSDGERRAAIHAVVSELDRIAFPKEMSHV